MFKLNTYVTHLVSQLVAWWHFGRTKRFLIWTVISFLTNLGITVFFTEVLLFKEHISFAIALVFVFFMNFLGCRFYIFNDSKISWRAQFTAFFLSTIGFRISEYLTFYLLVRIFHMEYILVFVLVTGVSFCLKQYITRMFVFPKSQ